MTAQAVVRDRIQERAILAEIWQGILPHLTCSQRLLEELTIVLQRTMGVSSFDLLLIDKEGQFLYSVASWNVGKGSGELIALGEGICGRAAQRGELCRVPDATQLVVPLMVDDRVLGVIDVRRDRPNAFSQEDGELISAIAEQVAYALDYALRHDELTKVAHDSEERLREQTQEIRAEQARTGFLYQVTQEMTRSLDLERVLNRALVRVSQALGVPQGSIMLLDQESGYLVYRAALGRNVPIPQGGKVTRFRRGVGLAGWVLAHNQHAIITGLDEDPRWESDPEKLGQSQSLLAVPLSLEQEVLGVMLLFHPQPDYFRPDHVQLAMAAANHITVAVQNSELYRMIRDQATRLGRMLREQQSVASQRMAILSSIADGVIVSDERNQIVVVNDAARRFLIRPTESAGRTLIGRSVSVLFAGYKEEGQQAVLQAMAEVKGRPYDRQYIEPVSVMLAREGQVVQASFTPMVEEEDQFIGTVIVLRDVTQEQEIAQAKNEFVSVVAHELRTPMTSIKGYTELMLQGATGALSDGQQHFLGIVKSNIDRLAVLVDDLLDISRIEAGRIQLELESLQLHELVREACDSVAETIKERGLTLNVDLSAPIPTVRTDRNRVIEVLVNLLSNAYRYTPAGGTIALSAHPLPGAVQIDVVDTGIGIAAGDQERIFEPFYRVDHPVVNEQIGTGLGLPIVRSLIQKLGGRLWLQSELGKGSTFSFTLPLNVDQ